MAVFFRILGYARGFAWTLVAAFVLSLVAAGVELARPWPIKLVVDGVLSPTPPAWYQTVTQLLPGAHSHTAVLVWAVGITVGLVLLSAALSLLVMRLVITVAQGVVFKLAVDVYEKLQRLSLSFHSRRETGDLMQRASADVFVAHFAVSQVLLPGLVSVITLAAMFLIMLRIDAVLALIALGVVPALVGALAVFAGPLDRVTRRQYDQQGALMAFVENGLSGIKAVQGFTREPYMRQRLEAEAADLGRAYNVATMVSSAYEQASTAITGIGSAVLLGVGGARVLSGDLSLGDLLVFLAYIGSLYAPVTALSTAVAGAAQVVGRGRRVLEILDATDVIPERRDAIDLGRARGAVAFEDVRFGYISGSPVLCDITFSVPPGQVIAVVGPSGVGKSSLAALLPRFYDPWSGRITLDGHDVRDLSLRSLRHNISLVLQDAFLFPISVAENIAFGRPDATAAEIEEAARAAQAHEFISRLPDGYATVIGDHGATLSGGERQRIAIARAILKDAPVLILDEPTSALDARTESKVLEAMASLRRNRTAFVISHRPSALEGADVVIRLEGGRLAALEPATLDGAA